jgi:ribonuclease HI
MEILAAIIAFEKLKTPHSIELYSDSNLLVSAFNQNWLSNWQKNGWKKADKSKVINQDLWQRMITAVKPHKVKFIWVKGHANNFYNEFCDKISKEAAESDKLRIDEVYEKENS